MPEVTFYVLASAAEQQKFTAEELKACFDKYYEPTSLLKVTMKDGSPVRTTTRPLR